MNRKSNVRWIKAKENDAGQRLDNFLFKSCKGVPKTRIYRGIRKGEFRVNGGRVKSAYKINPGDSIRLPPLICKIKAEIDLDRSKQIKTNLLRKIIYEDKNLLVIDKPCGLAVHGGSGLKFGLIEGLRHFRANDQFLELAHRIDRETSGLLVLARTPSMLKYLHLLFRNSSVEKKYLALVRGKWPRAIKRVEAPIQKNVINSGERISVVSNSGKPALTIFRVIERFKSATLVEARPITGRTHQIRVHALHVGNPILGDKKYDFVKGSSDYTKDGKKIRLFLHSHFISLRLPDGRKLEFSSPIDWNFDEILDF